MAEVKKVEILEHDDFRNIFKKVHLTPAEWVNLQKIWKEKVQDRLFQTGQLNVYSCLCRSPWCPQCSKTGKVAETIRERLSLMRWDKVRQVVLTVNREKAPAETFETIRKTRAISKTIKKLGLNGSNWLWVLEFHKGGYPHWHLFIETTRGGSGMIGKKAIQRAWKHGLVWETYAKTEKHWKAITGYHKKTGYFAAETKQHQLELPEYLQDSNRVRKYASNFKTPAEEKKDRAKKENIEASKRIHMEQDDLTIPEDKVFHVKQTRKQRPYRDRIEGCNKTSKVRCNNAWIEVKMSGKETRKMAKERLDEIDYKTYQGSSEDVINFIASLPD